MTELLQNFDMYLVVFLSGKNFDVPDVPGA